MPLVRVRRPGVRGATRRVGALDADRQEGQARLGGELAGERIAALFCFASVEIWGPCCAAWFLGLGAFRPPSRLSQPRMPLLSALRTASD